MLYMDILKKACDLLKHCNTVSFAVITQEGFPYVFQMEKVMEKSVDQLYFIAKIKSNKVALLINNPKSGVCASSGDDQVSLIGNTVVIFDEDTMREILPEEYLMRLAKRDMSQYCVLHFKKESVKVYIDGIFHTQ